MTTIDTLATTAHAARAQATKALEDYRRSLGDAVDDLSRRGQIAARRAARPLVDGAQRLSARAQASPARAPEPEGHYELQTQRDFGRSHPALYAAGAILVGFALARLILVPKRKAVTPAADAASAGGSTPQAETLLTDVGVDPVTPL